MELFNFGCIMQVFSNLSYRYVLFMLIIFLQKLSNKTIYVCYHRSIIKYFIYLVELLLDEDAECIEALSALESRVGE